MGQHKTNLLARLAKQGVLPPKEPKRSKREVEREIDLELLKMLYGKFLPKVLGR